MFSFKVRYCKRHMVAFIDGELSEGARRRVARYIDESPACYALYRERLDAKRDLSDRMMRIGHAAPNQLDRIWAAVQQELSTPVSVSRRRSASYGGVRYGLVAILFVMALLMPLLLSEGNITQAAATQPTPETQVIATAVAASTQITPLFDINTPASRPDLADATEPRAADAQIVPKAAPQVTPAAP